jgi:amino acid permease
VTQPYLGFTFLFLNQLFPSHSLQPGIVSCKPEPLPSALTTNKPTSRPCCLGLDEGLTAGASQSHSPGHALGYICLLSVVVLIPQCIPVNATNAAMAGSNKTFQMMAEPTSAQSSTEDLRQRNVNREKTIGGTGDYSRDGENSGSGQDRLDRYLSSKPIVAFGLTLQASWEAIAISFQSVLVNGGPSTLVYGMILSIFGSTAMAATLAELASMKPCVGAQYRWTAMLAPKGTDPRFWGFIQGYLTVFAWNFACALNPFLMGGMIQGCITLCDSSYVPKGWHNMLLSWASMALPIFCNVYARRILAPLEIAAAILHVLGFIVFVVVLVVMARRSTTDFVFETAFYGQSGWENKGVQWSIGLLAVIFPIGGYDSILHMADEVKDAPRKIPLAMVWATITSGIIGFAFIIVLLFCLGYVFRLQFPLYHSDSC